MSKLIVSSRYGTTPNEILNHKEISLKAKGLYGFLQCKPDNWSFSTERISSQIKESEKVVRATLQELENFGLLTRKLKPKDEQGKWTGYDYTLHEEIKTTTPKPSLPKAVGRINDRTDLGDDISNKDNSKQDIVNSIDTAKPSFAETVVSKEHSKEIQEVLNIFYEINPTLNFGNTTQRKTAEELIKKFGYEKTINTVRYAVSIQGKPYTPTITTPTELKNNMAKLMIYYKRELEPKKGVVPNFKF
jgi:hypothetical protein